MPRPANPALKLDLLKAAATLLDRRGDADFSMRELCGQVDYSVTAAYRVFRGRAHLLQALQIHLFSSLAEALVAEPIGDVTQQITALGRRFLAWAVVNPARYRFMFHSTAPEALLDPADQELARAPLRYLEVMLADAEARGELSVPDPAAAAVMLFATLHGLVSLHLAQRLDAEKVPDLVGFYDSWASTWMAALAVPASRKDRV